MKLSASFLHCYGRLVVTFLFLLTASVSASASGGGPAKRAGQHLHHKGLFHKLFKGSCLHHHAR